jgi:hypothetical protein
VFSAVEDVPGQASNGKIRFAGQDHDNANEHDDQTEPDDQLANVGHHPILKQKRWSGVETGSSLGSVQLRFRSRLRA